MIVLFITTGVRTWNHICMCLSVPFGRKIEICLPATAVDNGSKLLESLLFLVTVHIFTLKLS
jgi:hypothetical protein